MGIANKTHWIGVFLLFTSSILLLITTISAPIWNHVGLLRVTTPNEIGLHHTSVSFGTFGYCILNAPPGGDDFCTHHHIGYSPARVMAGIDNELISEIAAGTSDSLTRVMVLHPIECGFAFIAFLLALGHGTIGSFTGAMVALGTWVLVLISLACDFTLFGIIHHHVNDDGSGSRASFGSGIWCLAASFVTLFFGMIVVFFTCFSNRREKKRREKSEEAPAAPRRKRFYFF